jgi:hypothetical protein
MGRAGTVVTIVNEDQLRRLEIKAKLLDASLMEMLVDEELPLHSRGDSSIEGLGKLSP